MKWWLIVLSLIVGSLVASLCRADVTAWSTVIESKRSIAWLIWEAGMGVLNATDGAKTGNPEAALATLDGASVTSTRLSVDGRPQSGRISVLAAWRLLGFIFWDAPGSVERTTEGSYRGNAVRIVDGASNGRFWVRCTVGPPLCDRRVKQATLTLEANEDVVQREHLADDVLQWLCSGLALRSGTRIQLSCSAQIDLPCDARRERVHARRQRWGCDRPILSERIASDEAGPILRERVDGLADAGRRAVVAGRQQLIDSVVAKFLEDVCR